MDKFIRVFGLDRLAATCLKKLEDDEAAYVIESCQGRLKHAPNPSAVVMIAIRGAAQQVGRRYWGKRGAAKPDALFAADALGCGNEGQEEEQAENREIEFIMGSPSQEADEEAEEADETGNCAEPLAKRRRANLDPLEELTDLPAAKAEVCSPPNSPEDDAVEEGDDDVFFVDTGA